MGCGKNWTVEVYNRETKETETIGPKPEDQARNDFAMICHYPAPHVKAVTLRNGRGTEVAVKRWATPKSKGIYTLRG